MIIQKLNVLIITIPTIESDRTIAIVSFPLKSALQQNDAKSDAKNDAKNDAKKDVDIPVNVPVNVLVNVPVNVPVNLTETQRKILELITQNVNITHSEMAKVLSITERTARRTTKTLREMGLLQREGSDKTGIWITL